MSRESPPAGRPLPLGFVLPSLVLLTVIASAVVMACASAPPVSSPGTSSRPTSAPRTASGTAADSPVPTSPPQTQAPAGQTAPSPSATPRPVSGNGIAIIPLINGLERPLALAFTGGASDPIFVAQQTGLVSYVDDREVQDEPVLDLSNVTLFSGEQGLLGIALHPNFDANRLMYVSYVNRNNVTILAEYSLPDRRHADQESARQLLRLPQETAYHKAGALVFGPRDGMLYMSIGDDAWRTADTPDYTEGFRGTVIRIDVNERDGDRPYGIPEDNPFVDGPAPEVFDYGLRNPWRISFDTANGDMYIADVGSERYEEVSRHRGDVPPPLDFGWGAWEGFECRRHEIRSELDCEAWADADPPILAIEGGEFMSGECAIIGGYVYHGGEVPALDGLYVFGDYCSGRIRVVPTEPERPTPEVVLDTDVRIGSFGMDRDGELYIADVDNGIIYGIVSE